MSEYIDKNVGLMDYWEEDGTNPQGYYDSDSHTYRGEMFAEDNSDLPGDYDEIEKGLYKQWHVNSYFTDAPYGKCNDNRAVGAKYWVWPFEDSKTNVSDGSPNNDNVGADYNVSLGISAGVSGPWNTGVSIGFSITNDHTTYDNDYDGNGAAWDIAGLSGGVPTGPDDPDSNDEINTEQGVWCNVEANSKSGTTCSVEGRSQFEYAVQAYKCGYWATYTTDKVKMSANYYTI